MYSKFYRIREVYPSRIVKICVNHGGRMVTDNKHGFYWGGAKQIVPAINLFNCTNDELLDYVKSKMTQYSDIESLFFRVPGRPEHFGTMYSFKPLSDNIQISCLYSEENIDENIDLYIVHAEYPTIEEKECYWFERRWSQWKCLSSHNLAKDDRFEFQNWWEEAKEVDETNIFYSETFDNDSDDVKSIDGFDRDSNNDVSDRDEGGNGKSDNDNEQYDDNGNLSD